MLQNYEKQIIELLQKLGLQESEITVFLTGLQLGPSTISQLSEATKYQRITTHAIVERLLAKGLFLQTQNKRKRLVYPNTLDSLTKLIDQKKYEIHEMEQALDKTKPLLESIKSRSENFPKVRFYKGKEGIQIMMKEIISDKQDLYLMSDAQHFYALIDNDFLEKSLEIRKKHDLQIQMIFPVGFEHFCYTQGTYEQKLIIKALPEQKLLQGGITLRGNKGAYHCYQDGFLTTTIIDDGAFSEIMKYLFHNVWENSKDY